MSEATKDDAAKAAEHELLLEFPHFNERTAWEVGSRIRASADAAGQAVTIDIRMGDNCLFLSAMPGTNPSNADWARRKRNLVNLLHMASYRIEMGWGAKVIEIMALDPRDHVAAGGCFPIRVAGSGVVGTITVSGLPSRDDHKLVVDTVAAYLGVDLGDSAY